MYFKMPAAKYLGPGKATTIYIYTMAEIHWVQTLV